MNGRLLVSLAMAVSQALNPPPNEVAKASRPLQPAEIAAVLAAARQAVAGRTVRVAFAPDGPGPDILFGTDGRRRIVRTLSGVTGGFVGGDGSRATWHTTVETIAEYTGRPARGCDGSARSGELVIEYSNENDQGWKAVARTGTDHEVAAPIVDLLAGTLALTSGEISSVGDRKARAIVAPWSPPAASITWDTIAGDPLPNVPRETAAATGSQMLWIDVESLRPIKWAVSLPGVPSYALTLTYDRSPEPRIPGGVARPDCVR